MTTAREAINAYRDARYRARRASTFWLKWRASRGARRENALDDVTLARLAAVRAELRSRGERVPGREW